MSHMTVSPSPSFSRPSLGTSVYSHPVNNHVVNTIKPIVNQPKNPIVNTIKPIVNNSNHDHDHDHHHDHDHDYWYWKNHRYDPYYYPDVVVVPPVVDPVPVTGVVTVPSAPTVAVNAPVVAAPNQPAPSTNAATTTCLTKEYRDNGSVMFRDVCTKEWAVNSTDVTNKVAASPDCLTKESNNSVVTFRDTCTNEWAMNTTQRQAQVQ